MPPTLLEFRARAEEVAQELPDEMYATDRFELPAIREMGREELMIFLMVYEEERERRDIPDPNDLDEDLEWEAEDGFDFPED